MLPDLTFTYDSLLTNRQCWLIFDQVLQEEGLPSGGLDYLRDVNLEKRVLSRVNQQNRAAKNKPFTTDKTDKQNNNEESINSTPSLSVQSPTTSSLSTISTVRQSTSSESNVNVSNIEPSSPSSISKVKINNK